MNLFATDNTRTDFRVLLIPRALKKRLFEKIYLAGVVSLTFVLLALLTHLLNKVRLNSFINRTRLSFASGFLTFGECAVRDVGWGG